MPNQRQLEILTYLSGFGRDLEESWDVPREISLAGLAEHLGVVRSALHPPLNSLEEEGLDLVLQVILAPLLSKVPRTNGDANRAQAGSGGCKAKLITGG